MKKYTLTALVLMLIAGICAALIASVNLLTAPIIEKNNGDKTAQLCKEIFPDYDASASSVVTEGFSSNYIVEKIIANDRSSTLLGYIYTVEGSNSYGQISLLVGIHKDYRLAGIRMITNGQSYSNETETHLNTQYHPDMTLDDVLNLDLTDTDVTAGATFASKLIQSLVSAAFQDATGQIVEEPTEEELIAELSVELFPTYDPATSTKTTEGLPSTLLQKITVRNASSTVLGYLYVAEGSNNYGSIKLLIGINSDEVLQGVRFINNGQSFADKAETHLNSQYHSGMTYQQVTDLDLSDKNTDVTAGATYSARLIQRLVLTAFEDATGQISEEPTEDEKIEELSKEIFASYDKTTSSVQTTDLTEGLTRKITVRNASSMLLGYLYVAEGENRFGPIQLLIGIQQNGTLQGVRFINNGQSFADKTETHLNSQYQTGMTYEDILNLDLSDKNTDVTAGATYAARLIQSLVIKAFGDAKNQPTEALIDELSKELFYAYNQSTSTVQTTGLTEGLSQKTTVNNSSSTLLGYLYVAEGQNRYGTIQLLIGINQDGTLQGVRFINNGQSFGDKAETHLNTQYKKGMTYEQIQNLDLSDKNTDVTAGATYSARLIQELVLKAFDHLRGGM